LETQPSIGVIVPVYKCKDHLHLVFKDLPYDKVAAIVIVDDCCPVNTGEAALQMAGSYNTNTGCKVLLVKNEVNKGVGGAIKTGARYILDNFPEVDYMLKLDGDGQMDPQEIKLFSDAAARTNADYIKGNRFAMPGLLRHMPKLRLFGNSMLSFMMKLCTGNYALMDPTCGYLMMHRRIFEQVNLSMIPDRFFFESKLLGEVALLKFKIVQVPVKTIYGMEESNLKIRQVLFEFPPKISRLFMKRLLYQYFLHNFSFGSIALMIGIPLFFFSVLFGSYHWIHSVATGQPATSGTVMLSGLSFLISIQCAIIFFSEDIKKSV
jgi:dolichol-phosphate mannosyltransferase